MFALLPSESPSRRRPDRTILAAELVSQCGLLIAAPAGWDKIEGDEPTPPPVQRPALQYAHDRREIEIHIAYRAIDLNDQSAAYAHFLAAAALTFGDDASKSELLRLSREAYARWTRSAQGIGHVGQASFIDALPNDPTAAVLPSDLDFSPLTPAAQLAIDG